MDSALGDLKVFERADKIICFCYHQKIKRRDILSIIRKIAHIVRIFLKKTINFEGARRHYETETGGEGQIDSKTGEEAVRRLILLSPCP